MADESQAETFFSSYSVENFPRFSDPEKKLYDIFGLKRGNVGQMFGWKNFKRGFEAISHGIGMPVGDPWQMPGAFVIHQGNILASFIHETASDVPNYEEMVCGLSN